MKVTLKNANGEVKQEQTRTRTKAGTKDLVIVYIPDDLPNDGDADDTTPPSDPPA